MAPYRPRECTIRLPECQSKTGRLVVAVKCEIVSERENRDRKRGRESTVAISAGARIVGGGRRGMGGDMQCVCACVHGGVCACVLGAGAAEEEPGSSRHRCRHRRLAPPASVMLQTGAACILHSVFARDRWSNLVHVRPPC